MARPCTICRHPERATIDQRLVAGEPATVISSDFGLSERAIQRHCKTHLPALLVEAYQAQEATRADRLLADMLDLQERTLAILSQAEQSGDHAVGLKAIQQARSNLDLLARLMGQLRNETNVNVIGASVVYRIMSASGDLIEEGGIE